MQAVTPATRDQIEGLIGDADPLVVEQLEELGATYDELAEALADVNDEQRGEPHEPRTPRIAEAREILFQVLDRDADVLDEAAYP